MLTPTPALEVMDKEPTVLGMWLGAFVFGALGFYAARWRRWAALPFVAFELLALWATLGELHDPVVGPAILREAGPSWPVHLYVTTAIACLLAVLGAVVPKRPSRAEPTSPPDAGPAGETENRPWRS